MTFCPHCKVDRSKARCRCCCSQECPYLDQEDAPDGPCEGPVEAVDEMQADDDYYWVHRCQKHAERYYRLGY